MYTTLEAFERRLGRAYCEIYATDAPRALADLATAQAEIDGKLARRYAVPLTGQVAGSLAAEWQLVLASELAFGSSSRRPRPAICCCRTRRNRPRPARPSSRATLRCSDAKT